MSSATNCAVFSASEIQLLRALQQGMPRVPRPYQALARQSGLEEEDVIRLIGSWLETGLIKRFGIIVRHHELGYRANAMVVFDISDDEVAAFARLIVQHAFVTLCYRRPRRPPEWPYNLFCMIHGRDRAEVELQIGYLREAAGIEAYPHAILFSTHCYKQRGARYPIHARQTFVDADHG